MSKQSIGAIWEGKTKNGADKLNISLNINGQDYKFIAFKNTYKAEDKHPDWNILIPINHTNNNQTPQQAGQSAGQVPNDVKKDFPF